MADDNVEVNGEEQEAVELGWAPKDKWRGDPEKWVDAATFLERGRHILPIVQENNQRLKGQVDTLSGRLASTEAALRAATAAIEAIQESQAEDVKEQVEAARTKLKEELASASREGDHEGVAEITDKLTQLNKAEDAEDPLVNGKAPKKSQTPQLDPEVTQWFVDNPDFVRDGRRIALARAIGEEFRAAGDMTKGKVFMDKVAAEVDKTLGGAAGTRRQSKVEGAGGSGRSGGSGGEKGYNDLPPEAKAACEKQANRLVGPNRVHKDITSWRNSYAKQYFKE